MDFLTGGQAVALVVVVVTIFVAFLIFDARRGRRDGNGDDEEKP